MVKKYCIKLITIFSLSKIIFSLFTFHFSLYFSLFTLHSSLICQISFISTATHITHSSTVHRVFLHSWTKQLLMDKKELPSPIMEICSALLNLLQKQKKEISKHWSAVNFIWLKTGIKNNFNHQKESVMFAIISYSLQKIRQDM